MHSIQFWTFSKQNLILKRKDVQKFSFLIFGGVTLREVNYCEYNYLISQQFIKYFYIYLSKKYLSCYFQTVLFSPRNKNQVVHQSIIMNHKINSISPQYVLKTQSIFSIKFFSNTFIDGSTICFEQDPRQWHHTTTVNSWLWIVPSGFLLHSIIVVIIIIFDFFVSWSFNTIFENILYAQHPAWRWTWIKGHGKIWCGHQMNFRNNNLGNGIGKKSFTYRGWCDRNVVQLTLRVKLLMNVDLMIF